MESVSQQADSKNQLVHNRITSPEPLDFDECLKDSPRFRNCLKDNLTYIEQLEGCMARTIKQVSNYIETGKNHVNSQKEFINSMRILNATLGDNSQNTNEKLESLLKTLEEVAGLYEIVIDQSARTVGTCLGTFINDDLVKLKEARKSFDKISHEFDQTLTKYSQPPRKQQEDSENLLIATSTAFTHTSLDLSIQLTSFRSKSHPELLSSLLSFVRAQSTFYHQGYDLFEDFRPVMSSMEEHLVNIQDNYETLIRNLPSKHLMVSNNELKPLCFDDQAQQVYLEGYLFKRASNGFKVWNRKWFILRDHQLLYQKRGDMRPTLMESDVRLLTVRALEKADNERRFCFEILSPHKSYILQADTESACKTWISAIQAGINAAFHDTDHKSDHSSNSDFETQTGEPANTWTSGFSFKALQQHASNKLNSITKLGDHSTGTGKNSHKSSFRDRISHAEKNRGSTSGNDAVQEGDGDDHQLNDKGCSYVPLRENDDCSDGEEDENEGANEHRVAAGVAPIYPAPKVDASTAIAADVVPSNAAPEKPQRAYMKILAVPGNEFCADCHAPQPRWASINLGITLCIECAGIHRSLGVHMSKVRSLTLDTEVWSPEIVQLMLNLGNSSVNAAYMASYRGEPPSITPTSCREDRENWIKKKYLLKNFMGLPGSNLADDDDEEEESISTAVAKCNNKAGRSGPIGVEVMIPPTDGVIEKPNVEKTLDKNETVMRSAEKLDGPNAGGQVVDKQA